MCELLTISSINTDPLHRSIFEWHARFDVMASILADSEAILSRDWYIAREEHDAEQATKDPESVFKQLILINSINRRLGMDMASLQARLSNGMVSLDQYALFNLQLAHRMHALRSRLHQLNDPEHTVVSFPNREPLTDDDIVDPYVPGILHTGPLWDLNFAWLDFHATELMFNFKSYTSLRHRSLIQPARLAKQAFDICQLAEAVDRWPDMENGYLVSLKNCIGMASIFLPSSHRHHLWCRRKFAKMEQNG